MVIRLRYSPPSAGARRILACPWPRALGTAAVMAGIVVPVPHASALWDDRLEVFAAEKATHDDNVFRISSGRDPASVLGSPSKSDTFRTTTVGFNFDVPVSRQRFQGGLSWNETRYDRFRILDLNGHDGRATWLWQAGDRLDGQLGYTESRALASLANVQSGGVQSGTPNPLLRQRAFFNAGYRLTPRWRAGGEVSRLEQSNAAATSKLNDVAIDSAGITVTYATPSGNQAGVNLREDRASYPNPQIVAGSAFDNAYRQHNFMVVTDWTVTGHSRLSAQGGVVRRSYEQLPQRDVEIPTFRVTYDWKPTGKLTLTAVAQRDLGAAEEVTVGHVVVKGLALRPALRLTEKIDIGAALERSERQYGGDPFTVLGFAPERTDRIRAAEMIAAYRPTRKIRLELSWRHERRASSMAFGDYEANVVSLSARLGF